MDERFAGMEIPEGGSDEVAIEMVVESKDNDEGQVGRKDVQGYY